MVSAGTTDGNVTDQKYPTSHRYRAIQTAFSQLQLLDLPRLAYWQPRGTGSAYEKGEANMDSVFDIFELLPGGPRRVMTVPGAKEATEQMARLARTSPGEYFTRSREQVVELEQPEEWAEVT